MGKVLAGVGLGVGLGFCVGALTTCYILLDAPNITIPILDAGLATLNSEYRVSVRPSWIHSYKTYRATSDEAVDVNE